MAHPEPSLPQAFFCGRSDYFRALLDDHFRENEELEASGGLLAITLHDISPDIFTHVLYYIYGDHTEVCALGRGGGRYTGHVTTGLRGSAQVWTGSERPVLYEAGVWVLFELFYQVEGPWFQGRNE